MACFIIPTTEAIVTTVANRFFKKHECQKSAGDTEKLPFSVKLGWLNKLLWGGSALLAFEHLWHGEIQPFFPFLTAASDAQATAEMLREMATSGVAMSVLVTLVWGVMVLIAGKLEKQKGLTMQQEAVES